MKRLLPVTFAIALLALTSAAHAGQIWTDGNGDGLPDSGALAVAPSTNVTVGVWIDAQSFNWTNYLAYVEWTANCFSYISATYVITGGSNFPIDNFSHPRAIGFSGSGFNEGGVDHIGNYVLHVNLPTSCCVSPIIDIYNPYYVFSQLGAGSSYLLFTSNPGTCYGTQEPSGACCYPDGSCDAQFALDCLAGGGVYQGDGTLCAQVNCPQPPPTGACCFCDASCQEGLTPEECAAANGVYAGDGTSCPCPGPPSNACCLPDGSCFETPPCLCVEAGGVPFQGQFCGEVVCPQPPTGACCLPDLTCLEGATAEECAAAGGVWFPEAFCDEVCVPDATESRSWGKIKGLFR